MSVLRLYRELGFISSLVFNLFSFPHHGPAKASLPPCWVHLTSDLFFPDHVSITRLVYPSLHSWMLQYQHWVDHSLLQFDQCASCALVSYVVCTPLPPSALVKCPRKLKQGQLTTKQTRVNQTGWNEISTILREIGRGQRAKNQQQLFIRIVQSDFQVALEGSEIHVFFCVL